MIHINRILFNREMHRSSLSLILWTVVITILILLTMAVYPTFIENQSKVLGMISLVPKEALQFKGISNIEDMLSVLGFYSVNNIIYMMVLGSVFAVVLSSNILLREEYQKTAEYLLTRPLSRTEVFFSKLAVVLLSVTALNIITALAGYISMELVDDNPVKVKPFLVLSSYTLLLNLFFAAAGLLMSTLVKRPRAITTFSIGLVLVFYFVYTISKISGSMTWLGYITPFRYAGVNATDAGYSFNPWNLLYLAGLPVVMIIISLSLYRKKDIYV